MLPTDTVYGIGADAFSPRGGAAAAGRQGSRPDMPPPVLIGESEPDRALAIDVPEEAKDLIDRHWPGPLTVICRIQPSLRMDLGDSRTPSRSGCPITPWPGRSCAGPARWR